ncbi:MAG: hemerythrin family protein [Sulfuricurvum sp.]|uniref:bacteriohemerythrin n=1 Tax=Sulfuricurvum sp. TaxID=2025608 RepID=UPI002629610D|nr:hemerythrin family protein [Sulfuricurvum sp.]MDD2829278.1 hemerythrin family protein [Sulfuricurvum sp.]MDD4949958.1 hemerythrin family protein [Sulfuricurvum sp.]
MSQLPDALKVGVDSIDQRHEEFYTLYETLKNTPDSEFLVAFDAVILHTQNHFAEEEADMELIVYPNKAEHKQEHQKALDEMNYFREKASSGKLIFAKGYVKERLGDWLRNHLLNMDSDLARVITQNL